MDTVSRRHHQEMINTMSDSMTELQGTIDKQAEKYKKLRDGYNEEMITIEQQAERVWELETKVLSLLTSMQRVYLKYHVGNPNIGSEELMTEIMNCLCEVMGDRGYQNFMDKKGHQL